MSSTSACMAVDSPGAGSTQDESPECTPASSTCCITAATHVSSPSDTASTSISIALSRKRSTRVRMPSGAARPDGLLVVADDHVAAAQDVRRTNEHRVADPVGDRGRLVCPARHPPGRDAHAELVAERGEALAVLGEVDRVERRPQDRPAGRLERPRELERRLAAELDHDADGLLALADGEHLLHPPGARSRGGRRCRSRSRRSRGCS